MAKGPKSAFILGCGGCLSFIIAMMLFAAAFWQSRHGLTMRSSDDLVTWHNTREGRSSPLAENYVDFEFQYPKSWTRKPDNESNFVSVERGENGETWENFNVGYFKTAGSREGNDALASQLIAQIGSQFSEQFPGLHKLSEGPTTVGSYDAYGGLFETTVSGTKVYMRAILLPTPDAKKGVALILMGTSHSPDLKSAEDLGTKGDLPKVLASFRFTE